MSNSIQVFNSKIITMSISSSRVPLLTCQNPFCKRFNQKSFSNQTAYTNYIDKSPGCFNFLVRQAQVAAPLGASVVHPHCCQQQKACSFMQKCGKWHWHCWRCSSFHYGTIPKCYFVGLEAVQEFGISSGGSDKALVIDPGSDESSVLLDDNDDDDHDDDNDCLPNSMVNDEYICWSTIF